MIDNESSENYLEAILLITKRKTYVHSVEVARELHVSKPAVSRAVRLLTERGYVEMIDSHIHLTPSGLEYAETVYEKHRKIKQFLILLGVSEEVAEEDACRMEHIISKETFAAINQFNDSHTNEEK